MRDAGLGRFGPALLSEDIASSALRIEVPQQVAALRQRRARPGEIHRQGGFPDAAFRAVDCDNHLAAFFSASRTSASNVASGPSSSCAALTAALASAGLNPRLPSAERASAAAPPRGAGAAPAIPVPSLP